MLNAPLPHPLVAFCVIALVCAAAGSDIDSRRIPNVLVATGMAAALAAQLWLHGLQAGATTWATGAATGFVMLLPFYLLRGMAAGDVKLLTMVGAWLGTVSTFEVALATFLIGGIWALVAVAYRRRVGKLLFNAAFVVARWRSARGLHRNSPQMDSVGSLPYGVAIAAGTVCVLFVSVK
jgi:prepilin peptidase CpaA